MIHYYIYIFSVFHFLFGKQEAWGVRGQGGWSSQRATSERERMYACMRASKGCTPARE